jgi:hypothetical protein
MTFFSAEYWENKIICIATFLNKDGGLVREEKMKRFASRTW